MACAAPCHPALTRSARAAELNAGKETRGRKGEVVAHEGRGGPVWAKVNMLMVWGGTSSNGLGFTWYVISLVGNGEIF